MPATTTKMTQPKSTKNGASWKFWKRTMTTTTATAASKPVKKSSTPGYKKPLTSASPSSAQLKAKSKTVVAKNQTKSHSSSAINKKNKDEPTEIPSDIVMSSNASVVSSSSSGTGSMTDVRTSSSYDSSEVEKQNVQLVTSKEVTVAAAAEPLTSITDGTAGTTKDEKESVAVPEEEKKEAEPIELLSSSSEQLFEKTRVDLDASMTEQFEVSRVDLDAVMPEPEPQEEKVHTHHVVDLDDSVTESYDEEERLAELKTSTVTASVAEKELVVVMEEQTLDTEDEEKRVATTAVVETVIEEEEEAALETIESVEEEEDKNEFINKMVDSAPSEGTPSKETAAEDVRHGVIMNPPQEEILFLRYLFAFVTTTVVLGLFVGGGKGKSRKY